MPQHYTVPTKNAFAVLDDSDYEDRILSKPEESAEVPASNAGPKPAAAKQPPPKDEEKNHRQRPQGATRERGPRRPRPNEPVAAADMANGEEVDPQPAGPRRMPMGERRGGRRSSHNERTPVTGKREFDRQSGTGRGTEMKRSGHGAFNWGADTEFIGDEKAWETEGSPQVEEGARPQEGGETQPETVAPADEGPKIKSYAAYMAEMEAKKKALLPQHRVESATPEDPAKLEKEGYQVYTKEVAGGHKKEIVESDGEGDRKPKAVHLAEIAEQSGVQLHFQNSRGGSRGGRGRGGERPARGKDQQPPTSSTAPRREINLADSAAFPTLQAH
eukprot:Gregarina_sp_Poly_1__5207@NODE_275_length_10210_cov_177_124618_g240_i0_p4_GENE_NODE_275_length_10210_cov_177_124618_g240_i0NODE_275_length_10210_cov_177_124618_g240_i0_p4_ORF_typecomplete_len331_score72_65HABP4_PAIRBP1/PF04774_15/1_1e03HABP4_PAIRBP1/PF04774_15/1_4e12HABP4_PAIRBP1/PF04774_15/7_6e03GFRP/PF06399_13/0_24IHABP4_N/PF16174_5/0_029IHABP4_N/PF16174_5/5_2e03_NODE_275_length_10210_cov_177_124618_g240_i089949986